MALRIVLPSSSIIGTYEERWEDSTADAGTNTKTFGAVPSGQVWIVEGATALNNTHKSTSVGICILRGGNIYAVARLAPTAAEDAVQINSPITMFPGDALFFFWNGCTLNDDIYAQVVGIKFGIDLL